MADVTLTYQGDTILELSETGNKIIETGGTYCEADILLEYVKSGGGAAETLVAEYEATSDVAEIELSGDFGEYEYYKVIFTGSTNAQEWIYPSFTTPTQRDYYIDSSGSGSVGTINFNESNGTLAIAKLFCGQKNTYQTILKRSSNYVLTEVGNTFNYIRVRPYGGSSKFLSGFKVQIYGYADASSN